MFVLDSDSVRVVYFRAEKVAKNFGMNVYFENVVKIVFVYKHQKNALRYVYIFIDK